LSYYDYHCPIEHAICSVGDDTLERTNPADVQPYLEFQKEIGLVPHEVSTGYLIDQNFVGCNFKYVDGFVKPFPMYFEKNLWNLIYKEPKKISEFASTLNSYCVNYAFSDHFELFYKLLLEHGGTYIRSREYFRSMHDSC
jgi:hypothetical protein